MEIGLVGKDLSIIHLFGASSPVQPPLVSYLPWKDAKKLRKGWVWSWWTGLIWIEYRAYRGM
jgi:hypothetical protein